MVFLASGGSLNLLDVNPGLVIWTLVTFIIVLVILKKFAWDKILHALDARAEGIREDIEKAGKLRKDAELALKDYEEKIAKAKDEAIAIVNEAKSDATNLKNRMLEEANSDIRKLKDQSMKEIELAKAKAVQELQVQITDLSVMIASEILEKQLKADDYKAFVEKELSKLEKV